VLETVQPPVFGKEKPEVFKPAICPQFADKHKSRGISQRFALRLSVTERCNFHCLYCRPEPGFDKDCQNVAVHDCMDWVTYLQNIIHIDEVKLTGGEPLLFPSIVELVGKLKRERGFDNISLTTNGFNLEKLAKPLKDAGLGRVNVSLDSLDPDRFKSLTGGGKLSRTLKGIETALNHGLTPVKLNSVLLAETWKHDVPKLLSFAAEKGIELRFIELMKRGNSSQWLKNQYVGAETVREWIGRHGTWLSNLTPSSRPARKSVLSWKGTEITTGWITPRSEPFCESCNRLRLDSRGRLYRCLMDTSGLSIPTLVSRTPGTEASGIIKRYLDNKQPPEAMVSTQPMHLIGG